MKSIVKKVEKDFDGGCIKDFLKAKLGLSATLIKRVKFGGVYVNGKNVHMREILHIGDDVEVFLPEEESPNVHPIAVELNILYEDEYILCVDKPTGMPTHPSRYNSLTTLGNAVRAYMGGPFVFRAITRLDRDTSGIVLIAKDPVSASRLCEEMKAGNIRKTYTALLSKVPQKAEGVIDAPIERETPESIKRVVRADGKRAVTEYKVTEILSDGRAVCEVNPITGRTHQIRVHMAYIGCPLVNDFLYGEGVGGQCYSLRCTCLEFKHPVSNKNIKIKA